MYRVMCLECEAQQDIYRTFKQMDDLPLCCGKTVRRVICAPMVMTDIQPYRSMVTGEVISSRSQHRAHLKQHGVVEVGNETKYLQAKPIAPPAGLKETLINVAADKLRS